MSLERSEVEKIAHLARLAVDEGQLDGIASGLSRSLDLVEQMEQVDTGAVTPMAHPLHMAQRLRADAVTEPDVRQDVQGLAPAAEAGLYLVPRVIE